MYNESRKEKFISEYTSNNNTKQSCRRVFNVSEQFEKQWDQDICCMDISRLQKVVDNVIGIRGGSRTMGVFFIKKYILWCIANDYPNAVNNIDNINISGLDLIRRKMVANPKQLDDVLDAIFKPVEDSTIDNTHRCYYWMAFAGVPDEDALAVKCSDVDFISMSFTVNGDSYEIYKEALKAFRSCAEQTFFVLKHPNYSEKILPRIEGDDLLRGIRSVKSVKHMRTELSHRNSDAAKDGRTDKVISYERIRLSGLFYEIYERERAGVEPDFSGIVDKQMKNKEYNLDNTKLTLEGKRNRFIQEYQDAYGRWKIAFAI